VLSHLDLDALGGVMTLMGHTAMQDIAFWTAAGKVDVEGPHRLDPTDPVRVSLAAYWAWAADPANRAPRVTAGTFDATTLVKRHVGLIADIIGERRSGGKGSLHKAGAAFLADEELKNWASFRDLEQVGSLKLATRVSSSFVSHLYRVPVDEELNAGLLVDGVIALNTTTGAITLSWENGGVNRPSAEKVMQAAFGSQAGGREGIAGTPRGATFVEDDLEKVLSAIASCL